MFEKIFRLSLKGRHIQVLDVSNPILEINFKFVFPNNGFLSLKGWHIKSSGKA